MIMVQLQGASMLAMSCISLSQQDEPIQSEEAPSSLANKESVSSQVTSPDSPSVCGRQPKGPVPSVLERGPALKSSSTRRKPQLDCIAGNSGHYLSVKEENLTQISCAWSA